MDKPELSIIILSFNTKQITLNCLDSIYKETDPKKVPFEIIIIDNDSKDDSVKAIKLYQKTHPNLHLIENKANVGFGIANNQAVKVAKGEYLLLQNSDTVVLDRGIEKLYEFYRKNEAKMNFVGPKLYNKDMTLQPSVAPFFTPPVVFAFLFLRGDYWGLTRSSPNQIKRVGWIHGACFMTKKSIYEKVGGFDEKIFMYMEEVDLQYRAAQMGYTAWFYPDSHFIHLGSASSGGRTFPILQIYRGYLYFYKKHYGSFSLFLLKNMLQLKAYIALLIGKITHNQYLTNTYEQAIQLVKMDR
jgi:GT2 family glycosyltransferase